MNQPKIMGILNITPDSFSDGGMFLEPKKALEKAKELLEHGADIIDIGAESTAPHNTPITFEAEWERLKNILPILIEKHIPLSLDSYKSGIWEKALEIEPEYPFMLNDVSGLKIDTKEKISILKKYPQTKVIIMFSRDISLPDPLNLTESIISEITTFFEHQTRKLLDAGIEKNRIILDPGMGGFLSKNPAVSFGVIAQMKELKKLGYKILVGTSRKSFLKEVSCSSKSSGRTIPSVVTALECMKNGADILRVHDVLETIEGVKTVQALAVKNK